VNEASEPLITIPGHWDFDYTYFAGEAASRFFNELRINRRIMGTYCHGCERLLVPARGFCDACYLPTTEWRPVGNRGRVEAFTILTSSFPGLPEPPVAIGYVVLEGAATALLNFIHGVDLSDLDAAGARLLAGPAVNVEFKDSCEGRITDFHFVLEE
jgi:uncharacterized OB-fold protein